MQSIRIWHAIAAPLILVLSVPITGCGLKGDLYLPQEEAAQSTQPAEPPVGGPLDDQQAESDESPEAAME